MSLFGIFEAVDLLLPRLDRLWDDLLSTVVDGYLAPMWANIANVGDGIWDNWNKLNTVITWIGAFSFETVLNKLDTLNEVYLASIFENWQLGADAIEKLTVVQDYLRQDVLQEQLPDLLNAVELNRTINQGGTLSILEAITGIPQPEDQDLSPIQKGLAGIFQGALGGLELNIANALGFLPQMFFSELGERTEGLLETVINLVKDTIGALRNGLDVTLKPLFLEGSTMIMEAFQVGSPDEEIHESVTEMLKAIFERLEELGETERESFPAWGDVKNTSLAYSGIITAVLMGVQLLGVALDATHPVKEWGFREGFADFMSMIMPQMGIGTVVQMPFEVGTLRFLEYHLQHQYRPTLAGVGDLISMFQRGTLSEVELREYLSFHGYQNEFIDGYRDLAAQIPSPQDLVRFLVREVISPQHFDLLMEKQGFSLSFSQMFWESHWQLPAVGQVMEMFHRQLDFPVITLDAAGNKQITYPTDQAGRIEALDEYLKLADYAPEWRPFIRDISYNIITRVDARRGWEMGLLDDTDLDKIYRDAGYSPQDAQIVREIQKYATLEAERGELMRRAQDLYIEGWIDREVLTAYLLSFLPNAEMVDYRVSSAETERDLNNRADWVSIYIALFREETIDETKFASKLEGLNMEPWRIYSIIAKEQARRGQDVEER